MALVEMLMLTRGASPVRGFPGIPLQSPAAGIVNPCACWSHALEAPRWTLCHALPLELHRTEANLHVPQEADAKSWDALG